MSKTLVIDFHTHIFPAEIAERAMEKLSRNAHLLPSGEGTEEGLFKAMRGAGVTHSVVLPDATSERQVASINDASAKVKETMEKEGILFFGAIHPLHADFHAELARIRNLGFRGIKIHPVYQGFDLDAPEFLRILDRAAELGLIVVTHTGDDVGLPGVVHVTPGMALRALREIGASPSRKASGSFRLVLAHMGGWRRWDELDTLGPELAALAPAMIDTSFSTGRFNPLPDGYWDGRSTAMLRREEFCSIVRIFGADRVVFGSDFPWSAQSEVLHFIKESGLSGEETEQILYKNAAELLAL